MSEDRLKSNLKNISVAVDEEVQYLTDLKTGKIKPIITPYHFINKASLNGWHPSDINVIAGGTGTGKTALLNMIAKGIHKHNLNQVKMLIFNFELVSRKMVSRLVSSTIKKSMREIYQKEEDLELKAYNQLKTLPIDYCEDPLTVEQMAIVIEQYCNKNKNKTIISFMDHSLLVKRLAGDSERQMLIDLANMMNYIKKKHKVIFCVLSQLNDGINDERRLSKSHLHYPKEIDLFGGRALAHIADTIHIIMNPVSMSLPGSTYGIHKFPLFSTFNKITYPMIYAHSIKTRDGANSITPLANNLKYQRLIEIRNTHLQSFIKRHSIKL